MSEPVQVTINGATFSRYECQISCAINFWIKNANDGPLSDDTLGSVIKCLRGKFDETALPCRDMVHQIQHHSKESVRSIYMKVHINQLHWKREAIMVYNRWLKQNDAITETYDESDLESHFDKTTVYTSSSRTSSKSSNNRPTQQSILNKKLPIVIHHNSSSQGDKRLKETDVRYYPNSFHNSYQPQKKFLSCQTKDHDKRYYRGCSSEGPYQNDWSDEQPLPHPQVSPTIDNQSDMSYEVHPFPDEGDSSIGGSTKSEDSDEHCSVSSPNYDHLAIIYAKHQMMVTLMEEVYATFGPQWQANVRNHVTPDSTSSRSHLDNSKSQNGSRQNRGGKRAVHDREPSPDDNDNSNNGKKRRSNPNDTRGSEPDLQFACPFHKYDPRKYCLNPDTGARYRSCLGPGFSSISKLKQHLRRIHSAPIQCQRCWLIMKNMEEMGRHVNADVRCEPGSTRPEEGISQEKMSLISSNWGVNWEGIFRILFPGAPVPSPYYEPELTERIQPSSPQSNNLTGFEAYNRTNLPLLVEASLRPAVNARMEPIEEQLRMLIVDIVRNCQSTVARNWELMNCPSASTTAATQPASQETHVAHAVEDEASESAKVGASNPGQNSFVKPPELDDGTILPPPVIPDYGNGQGDSLPKISDLGYGSILDYCQCACHEASGLSSTLCGRLPIRVGVCTSTKSLSQTASARAVLNTTSAWAFRRLRASSSNETVVLYSHGAHHHGPRTRSLR